MERLPDLLFIDGERREAASGRRFAVEDPADGATLAKVADADDSDAHDALEAAVAAQPGWAATAPRERGELLRSAYEAIVRRTEDFAEAIAPFGGVKASGFGREGGFEGIEEYLDTTYIALPAG